jgi:hypothetical protein
MSNPMASQRFLALIPGDIYRPIKWPVMAFQL